MIVTFLVALGCWEQSEGRSQGSISQGAKAKGCRGSVQGMVGQLLPGTAACSKGWPLAPLSVLLELCDCAEMTKAPALQPPGFPIWSWCPCRATALLVLFLVKQVNAVFCVEATGLNIYKLFLGLCTAKPSFLKESIKGAGTLELYFILAWGVFPVASRV